MTDPATPSRTMTAGTAARLDRIGTDGRYVTVPMDHGLTLGATTGLVDVASTVDAVTRGGADAIPFWVRTASAPPRVTASTVDATSTSPVVAPSVSPWSIGTVT